MDIGSVTAKIVVVSEGVQVEHCDSQRITAGPRAAVASLLRALSERMSLKEITTAGVSGSGAGAVPNDLNWTEYSSSLAIASGLLQEYPGLKTIV